MPRTARKKDVPTIADIAEALEISTRRVSQLKDEGMPTITIEAAKAWRADQAKEKGGNTKDELDRARIRLVKEQELRIKYQNDESAGRLVSRDECREEWTRIGSAISAMLTAAESEIPRVCSGLELSQALPLAKAKMREIRQHFADEESAFWKRHEEKS